MLSAGRALTPAKMEPGAVRRWDQRRTLWPSAATTPLARLKVATAVNAHAVPHGRIDFRAETFVAHAFDARQSDVVQYGQISGPPRHRRPQRRCGIFSIMPMNSGKDYKAREVEVSQPIMAAGPAGGNQGGDYIVQPVAFALRGREDGAVPEIEGDGDAVSALRSASGGSSRDYVAFDTTQVTSAANYSQPRAGEPGHPLAATAHPPAVAFSAKDYGGDAGEIAPTVRGGGHDKSWANGGVMPAVASSFGVRAPHPAGMRTPPGAAGRLHADPLAQRKGAGRPALQGLRELHGGKRDRLDRGAHPDGGRHPGEEAVNCAHCEMLERQLAIAKKELSFRGLDMRLAAIIVRLGVTDMQARILLRLYEAGGKPVPAFTLADVLRKDASPDAVRNHVMAIRGSLGPHWIVTGEGYSLTAPALSQIMAALEPLELQDVRG